MLDRTQCVVTTGTRYLSMEEPRAQFALSMVRRVVEKGYRLLVGDNSVPEFGEEMKRLGAEVHPQVRQGMGPGRQEIIETAMNLPGITAGCFIEPEKDDMAEHLDKCFLPILGGATFVLSCRSAQSHQAYPPFQYLTECAGNRAFGDVTGRYDLDVFHGPRFFDRTGANLALMDWSAMPAGNTWGALQYALLEALHRQHLVMGVTVDYVHPPRQSQLEQDLVFHRKRVEQLKALNDALFWFALKRGMIEPNPQLAKELATEYPNLQL